MKNTNNMNEQQVFWKKNYSENYIKKNTSFDQELGIDGWKKMLNKAEKIESLLECGCNIGRNIDFLENVLPNSSKSIIELSNEAYEKVTSKFNLENSFNGSILDSTFKLNSFDLVFICGVLIHIHPDDVLDNMKKMFEYSNKYILIGEYFNRTPVMIEYQGQKNKLFKSDFGKTFMTNFDVELVDYGFLWGHIYDKGGFDDITWWLFKKNN